MPVLRKTINLTVNGNTLVATDSVTGLATTDAGVQGEDGAVSFHVAVPSDWQDITTKLQIISQNGGYDESDAAVGGVIDMPLRQGVTISSGRITVRLAGTTTSGVRKTADCKTLMIAQSDILPDLIDHNYPYPIHKLTGSGGALVTQTSNDEWNVNVTGTGGDMLQDNYANGNPYNPNTVDVSLASKQAQPGSALYNLVNSKANQADLNSTNAAVALKANSSDVNTRIAAIAGDYPKGLYATLSALKAAFPTGTTGKYVFGNSTNGFHWSIYSNGDWQDCGVYQASTNQPDIDKLKSFFNLIPDNLLNGVTVDTGHYYDYATGAYGTNANYNTYKVFLAENKSYTLQDCGTNVHLAFFDASNNFISGLETGNTVSYTFAVPSNQSYTWISIRTSYSATAYLNLSNIPITNSLKNELIDTDYIKIIALKKIVVGPSGDFQKLTDGIAEGMKYIGAIVYVEEGTYDIYSELGADYFTNFVYDANNNGGIILGNELHLIFASHAKVVFNYQGTNAQVRWGFSPFTAVPGQGRGFTIDNMTIEASNCRYCIHDDMGIYETPYRHVYKNCNMYIDNSKNTDISNGYYGGCIGGGLGYNGEIVVKDSIFGANMGSTPYEAVFWHNLNGGKDSKGNISISGCYVNGKGTLGCHDYGSNTSITNFLATNNSLGSAINTSKSTPDATSCMNLIEFNNIIRV